MTQPCSAIASIFGISHNHPGGGAHDHCNFPDGVLNSNQLVRLSIFDFNPAEEYLDIAMLNNVNDVVAYQFEMSGITIQRVENLVDANQYPISPFYSIDGMVVGISFEDSLITKTAEPQALCRIHYSAITADEICIDNIVEIVNGNYERTLTSISDGCVMITSAGDIFRSMEVRCQPNPFHAQSLLSFDNTQGDSFDLQITDVNGKLIRTISSITDSQVVIDRADMVNGVYFYQLKSATYIASGKLIVQ